MASNWVSLQATSWHSTVSMANPSCTHASYCSREFSMQMSFITTGNSTLGRQQRKIKSINGTGSRIQALVRASLTPDEVYQREETRWLREEQRWMREEERWHREEKRWESERSAMQQEIRVLKAALAEVAASQPGLLDRLNLAWAAGRVQGSEEHLDVELVYRSLAQSSVETLQASALPAAPKQTHSAERQPQPHISVPTSISPLAQAPPSAAKMTTTEAQASAEILAKIPAADVIAAAASRTVDRQIGSSTTAVSEATSIRRSLGVGAEGEDVKAMQLALEALGFYSGEDDILNSFFSEETESAVKTWQATMGVRENGVMSPELLAVLFGEAAAPAKDPKVQATTSAAWTSEGRAPRATRDKPEIERYARTDIEAGIGGPKRVFLLGENRWEEPDRLTNNGSGGSSSSNSSMSSSSSGKRTGGLTLAANRCHVCRGEGSLVCMECEGTGELNVEEQFLDWVGEDAKCLYCLGTGATNCDTCNGKGTLDGI